MTDFALITGGARGIGRATAARLREQGVGIVVFDVIAPEDPVDLFVSVDLSDTAATAAALDQALDGRAITRLVNNVGTVRPALLEDSTLEDFDYLMALNVRSAIQCTKALAPGMRAAKFGRIVNLSSRATLGKELRTNYVATKSALIGMTKTWALELAADGITVNCICPGPTATELYIEANPPDSPRTQASLAAVPVGRIGTPEDMAHAIAFFLDERSSFVTGQALLVCGGSSLGAR
jgi:NAD(P)-dependent dehydrogenase (short-subunit alcohol dehydrogenase family)